MKFITIKKRTLCVVLLCIILICSAVGVCFAVKATSSPKPEHTIVIDAGHGGVDVKLGQYIKQKSISVDMLILISCHKLSFLQKISCGYIIP